MYNQKFLKLVPQIALSVKSTIELSLKDGEHGLDYEGMKNYLRFVTLIVRLHKKVAPETVDVSQKNCYKSLYLTNLYLFFFIIIS